jgi:hypothetical protein
MKKTESPRILDNNLQREWPIERDALVIDGRNIDLIAAVCRAIDLQRRSQLGYDKVIGRRWIIRS